jgi:DNA-binding NarL/FixJ family response regulator
MPERLTTPVAVVDSFPLFRFGVFAALIDSDYDVVRLSGMEAIEEVVDGPSRHLAIIGVSLKDLRTPFFHLGPWRTEGPRLIFLTDTIVAVRALQSLAEHRIHGVLSRGVGQDELITCLDTVSAGQPYLSPSFRRRKYSRVVRRRSNRITRREVQIGRMLHKGLRNADIATELRISINTVHSHVRSLLDKLGVHNRTQIARIFQSEDQIAEKARPLPHRERRDQRD